MQLEGMDDVKAIVSACEDYGDDFDFKNFMEKERWLPPSMTLKQLMT